MGSSPTCSIQHHIMATQKKKHTAAQVSGLLAYQQNKECPACDKPTCKVIESRKTFDSTRRRYECYSCNYRFTTYEIRSEVYDELRSLRSKISQLQQIFADVNPPLAAVPSEPVKQSAPEGIPCFDCTHLNRYGCSFDIPEAQTEDACGCNLFQPIISDNMLT